MIAARLESNIEGVRFRFAELSAGIEEKAAVRALNRAGDQSATAASREIRKVYNLKASTASAQIKVRERASKGKLSFMIRIASRRIPLIEFAARQTLQGVTVQVKKGGGRKLVRHAFLGQMRSGHKGVFVRAFSSTGLGRSEHEFFRFGKGSGKPGRKWGQPDLPIAELTSLSVPRMFMEKTVRASVLRIAVDSFRRNFQQQVQFLSSRAP